MTPPLIETLEKEIEKSNQTASRCYKFNWPMTGQTQDQYTATLEAFKAMYVALKDAYERFDVGDSDDMEARMTYRQALDLAEHAWEGK